MKCCCVERCKMVIVLQFPSLNLSFVGDGFHYRGMSRGFRSKAKIWRPMFVLFRLCCITHYLEVPELLDFLFIFLFLLGSKIVKCMLKYFFFLNHFSFFSRMRVITTKSH